VQRTVLWPVELASSDSETLAEKLRHPRIKATDMLCSKSDDTSDRLASDDAGSAAVQTHALSSKSSLRRLARDAARDMESRVILYTLQQHHWNRRRTAEALNISYRSLMYKMKYCNLRNVEAPSPPEGR